jgi:hypothetical protein
MVLRVVIDSNRLQSDELRAFLQVNRANFAVLIDYAWMEAYKGNSVVSVQKSMSVLRDFPDQVIVLKGTKAVSALDPRAPGIAKRMYWSQGGREFQDTVEGLQRAEQGHRGALKQILDHGRAADKQMDKILAGMADLPATFSDMCDEVFTQSEVTEVKVGKEYGATLVRKLFDIADYLALRFYKAHPLRPKAPSRRSRYDAFNYRYAMASLIYFLSWVKDGGQMEKAAAKLRNDMIDISFATYGTYFNGVMTEDKRVRALQLELRVVLEQVGARLPEEYFETLIGQLKAVAADPLLTEA